MFARVDERGVRSAKNVIVHRGGGAGGGVLLLLLLLLTWNFVHCYNIFQLVLCRMGREGVKFTRVNHVVSAFFIRGEKHRKRNVE